MRFIEAKTILSPWSNGDGWFGSNYSMNLYKGCSHGCIYCDSRSECYKVDNFDEVRGKENALVILEKELRAKRKKGIVSNGAMSDPYNPFESKYRLTRGALELINKYGFGTSLLTKSDLIVRDMDLLKKIREHSPVMTKFTITTFDDSLCKKIEPRVSETSRRLSALEKLSQAGIFTGVLIWPILPFINDDEDNIKMIVKAAGQRGAKFVVPLFGVTLRQNQRGYFYHQLDKQFPGVKKKYINTYGDSYQCFSMKQKQLWELFISQCEQYNLLYKMSDIREALKREYENRQISFL